MFRIRKMRADIHNLNQDLSQASLSNGIIKQVKRWLKTLPPERLEFFAAAMPKKPWQEFCDMIHPSPKDFSLPYFLSVIFGQDPPENTRMYKYENELNENNVEQFVEKEQIPYKLLRRKISPNNLPDRVRGHIAEYTDLTTIIWYFEEISSPSVISVIESKLSRGEEPELSYGKLMERMMTFQRTGMTFYEKLIPIAANRLSHLDLSLDPPVSVFGDSSQSMQVSIRTSTIIASFMASIVGGETNLRFFNHAPIPTPLLPSSIKDVLGFANYIRASGGTAPAAALYPLYHDKVKSNFIVVVTDQEENIDYQDMFFAELLKKYKAEVEPNVKIVFVSFQIESEPGLMVQELREMGFECKEFKFDRNRPDLTKLDSMLGTIDMMSSSFNQFAKFTQELFNQEGFDALSRIVKYKRTTGNFYGVMVNYEILSGLCKQWSNSPDKTNSEFRQKAIEALNSIAEIGEHTNAEKVIHLSRKLIEETKNGEFDKNPEELSQSAQSVLDLKHEVNQHRKKSEDQSENTENKTDDDSKTESASSKPISKIEMLPKECLVNLFSYLPESNLNRMHNTCTAFRSGATEVMFSKRDTGVTILDLVFSVDCTSSMSPYILEAQNNIRDIVKEISKQKVDVQFALVMYRDHVPQDHTFVTKVKPFTSNMDTMQSYVDEMEAVGGGDMPESVADAFYEVLQLEYRPYSTKVCVHIADAPPHGMDTMGDGFPNGCPQGHDPLDIARSMSKRGITLYTVACSMNGRDLAFMKAVADITEGQCVPLNSADMLSNVVTGGAAEQVFIDQLKEHVRESLNKLEQDKNFRDMSMEQKAIQVTFDLQKQNIRAPSIELAGFPSIPLASAFMRSRNLSEANKTLETSYWQEKARKASRASLRSGDIKVVDEPVYLDQVRRAMKKMRLIS
eukprot:gb/GECH01004054.1/.p1 GENE.gb/GECH01004054.1/~~gb/GECH01004054.1/.p1  ORF type:complete len:906 (+),score=205.58 gb/GECH01004054.1/:1-2718(+)